MNIHKSIRFISLFTDYPNDKQVFYFKEKEINDFLEPSNINYIKTLEYCFLNLKKGDDIRLENNMKSITMKFSNTLKNSNFFYTLFELCKSKTPSLDNNSDKKIILYHYYIKELIQEPNNMPQDVKEFRQKEIQFLEDFWKLAKGTNINIEEEFLKNTIALAN